MDFKAVFAICLLIAIISMFYFYKSESRFCIGIQPKQYAGIEERQISLNVAAVLQWERQQTMRIMCEKYSLSPKEKKMIASKQNVKVVCSNAYKLCVCRIGKCGSTAWLRTLGVMEDFLSTDEYFLLRKDFSDTLRKSDSKLAKKYITVNNNSSEYLNLIMVRNPFDRIVSAYRGKLVPDGKGFSSYYEKLSKQIHLRFQNTQDKSNKKKRNDTASFEEFVHFLLNTSLPGDFHWSFFNTKCNPCLVEYGYIAKMETINEERLYLGQFLNLSEEHQKVFFARYKPDNETPKLTREYFEEIPRSLAQKLYRKYQVDFDLFGYAPPKGLF
ncbi:unnamed protein product [Clavelina lepadiformis]|uniref:Carbohydrate sulfotransferase n=1 Tax=Clavelina lepadiformis TaxID=159417 RepID=A0ABP0H354_CLALP